MSYYGCPSNATRDFFGNSVLCDRFQSGTAWFDRRLLVGGKVPAIDTVVQRAREMCVNLSAWRGSEIKRRVWGDGLVDLSLSALWYPGSWDDITADELVFLIPSLRSRRSGFGQSGIAPFIRAAVSGHAFAVKMWISRPYAGQTLRMTQADAGVLSGLVRDACASGSLREGRRAWCEATGLPFTASSSVTGQGFRSPGGWPTTASESVAFELHVLLCLNRLLTDCTTPFSGKEAPLDHRLTLADVLVGSVHSRINGAYVYPQFESCHELLTLAAWLGVLLIGRPALLPPRIAHQLVHTLRDRMSTPGEIGGGRDELLHQYAELAVGAGALLQHARAVERTGRSRLVRSSRCQMARPPNLGLWKLASGAGQ